jgi:hypothetical protein
LKVKRSHETGDDPIKDPPGELSCRWVERVMRMGAEVEQECGHAGGRRDLGASRFKSRERLDEEMPKLGRKVTRRRVDPSLCSVCRHVRSEPMTRWNTENLMKRPRVDVLGVSTELERQPSTPYIVVAFFEDAQRFGGRPNGSDAELI